MKNKNVQTLSIEGKDLLSKKYKTNKDTIYKGSLDDAMEVDELRKLNKKIIKLNKRNKRLYSDDIVTVTFKYACKKDKDLTDEEYERVESIKLALELTPNNKENKLLIKDTKELLKLAEKSIDKNTIRGQLYKYGFNAYINGTLKHFVRYKRSSGSARVGKCLFINEKFYKHMIDWSFAGISHEIDEPMDCASVESYISLPTSSCIGRLKLKPENILLIDDGKSTFDDTVMATRLIDEVKDRDGNILDGNLHTSIEEKSITNTIWDGESLLDKSVFDEYGYENKAILQIRNRFFKGIVINTKIQQFFTDNNINNIEQLLSVPGNKTIATNIEDIKLITTASSVKYIKYGTFENWLKYIVEDWGICKYEKPQHHFNGMTQTHYQLLNTLGMSYEYTREFLKDTVDYINLLKTDTSVFKFHLGLVDNEELDENDTDYELQSRISTKSDFIINMLDINDDFIHTKMCKKFREEIIDNYIKNARKGHILVEGNYSIVISSPLEYLKASIGKWNGSSLIKPNECVTSKFKIGEEVLGVRSPQPTMCNMTVFNNNKYNELDKYFNTDSKEVIFISAIGWNVFESQSSMDVDGDAMMITNNKYIIKSANNLNENIEINNRLINRFLVSTDFTPKLSIKRKYNAEDLTDTDITTSSNKIGEIINLAQMLNSVYWDKKFKMCTEEELFELYKDICTLNILSCIEIDRCKKLSPVNASREINKIRNKGYFGKDYIMRNKEKKKVGIRPYFFKFLDGSKDYKFKKYNTGMDYIEQVLDKEILKKDTKVKSISIVDTLIKLKASKSNRNSINRIKKYAKEMRYKQIKIWSNKDLEYKTKKSLSDDIYNDTLENINKLKITPEMIYTIFLRIDKSYDNNKYDEYKKIGRRILSLLYDSNKINFLKCIKAKVNNANRIVMNDNGKIHIYGIKYNIISK